MLFGFLAAFYFLPTINAVYRHHPKKTPIILINIFLTWTGLMWLVALIWSLWPICLMPEQAAETPQAIETSGTPDPRIADDQPPTS